MATVATRTAPGVLKPVETSTVNLTNRADVVAALREAKRLKAIEAAGKKAKEAREKLEEEVIRPAMEGARVGIVRGVEAIVRSSQRSNSHTDKAALAAGWPEAYEATLVTTYFDFFTYNVKAADAE
jgi:hypothetical protein